MSAGLVIQAVGWSGILALVVVLWRAIHGRFLSKYPLFYLYAGYVVVSSSGALLFGLRSADLYWKYYWSSQFVALSFGLGVMAEIYRLILGPYRGARRLANVVLMALLILASAYVLADGFPLHAASVIIVERDLRLAQSVLLFAVLVLSMYYQLPIGRNVRGIATGYGLFIGTSVLNLALYSYFGPSYQQTWSFLQPLEYCITVTVWCVFLWSYCPPDPEMRSDEQPYSVVSVHTELAFRRLARQLVQRSAL
jgi:hypothetical protein